MSKLCKKCGNTNENALLKLCKLCYYEDKIKNPTKGYKAIKKISNKKIQRLKEGGSEVDLFKEIWNERKHECEMCKKYIYEASSFCFAHRCPKGTYPEHRLKKDNISLVCSIKCHGEVDKIFSGIKRQEHIAFLNKYKGKE